MPPHSLPLCLIGAGLLWVGWFGFNAGSALSASPLAALAFLNTSTATSDRGDDLGGDRVDHARQADGARRGDRGGRRPGRDHARLRQRRRRWARSAVGVGVSVICYAAVTFLKPIFGYDDSLDAFGVHGDRRRLGRAGFGPVRGDLRRSGRRRDHEQRAAGHGPAEGHRLHGDVRPGRCRSAILYVAEAGVRLPARERRRGVRRPRRLGAQRERVLDDDRLEHGRRHTAATARKAATSLATAHH